MIHCSVVHVYAQDNEGMAEKVDLKWKIPSLPLNPYRLTYLRELYIISTLMVYRAILSRIVSRAALTNIDRMA